MFKILVILTILAPAFSWAQGNQTGFNWEQAKIRCTTHYKDSPELFMGTFSWGYSLLEMEDKFNEVYDSGERIFLHAHYDRQEDHFFAWLDDKPDQAVKLTEAFVKSVTLQIETSLSRGYASFVFFPDMGHSHLYFPEEHWQKVYAKADTSPANRQQHYENMLADPAMRPLYHLTEQLQMMDENKDLIDDQILKFKYWNRNFLGYNNSTTDYSIEVAPKEEKYNTVKSIDGYHSWSAGFAISASKDGCFPYRDKNGQIRFFDIALKDPRYDPKTSGGWDF